MVGFDVVFGGFDGGFGNFGGEYLAEVFGQWQGEVAIAAVEFEQVLGLLNGGGTLAAPVEHFLADDGVGLGEAVFNLAVAVVVFANFELFGDVVLGEGDFLFAAAADDVAVELFFQWFGSLFPVLV